MNKDEAVLKEFYTREETNKEELLREKTEKIEKLKSITYQQTKEEKELYKKFEEIARSDPDKKFKFSHIEELGVNADIVVVYGKKGIGKTYQISRLIDKLAEEDKEAEVILVRNTVSEFQALEKQLTVSYCPVYMKGKGNNPTLLHKEFIRDGSPRYMGFCVALTGFSLESAKGAEYPNIRLIIWDECTNIGEGTSYDASDIHRFITFFDSIIRNKTNVKIYIFGNFHRNTDGKVSDVLLDTLRIPYGCTLKLRESTSKDGQSKSRLLFINTGSLYSGIDANAKVSIFGDETIQDDLFTNLPQSYSKMTGGLNLFYSHKPEWGLLYEHNDDVILLLLSSFKTKRGANQIEINWMTHIEVYPSGNEFLHNIYTSSLALYNEFSGYGIQMISAYEEKLLILDLYEIGLHQSLYYSSDVSRLFFRKSMNKWQKEYGLGLDVSFFPTNKSL